MQLPPIGALFADFYELTMAAGYYAHRITGQATFSVFVRKDPADRPFYVATGLEDVLDALADFHFSDGDLEYLEKTGLFQKDFIRFLKTLRFTGSVYALPEGTVFFPNEPILEITAPMIEAQILETFVLNTLGFQTLVATKAARCVHAAQGRPLVDFSLRRTQGPSAGMQVARSTYLAGFTGTSNVLAGKTYGIPVSGTMAHSFVTAFETEQEAFAAYADTFPDTTVLLIDTYDTLTGAEAAARVANTMKQKGKSLAGVRLDSGDMVRLSREVRKILNREGLSDVKIIVSSGFDERKIDAVLSTGADIDAFGVGTKVGVSSDAPYMDIVYKLVRFKDRDIQKYSPGKVNLAGKKQIYRICDDTGRYRKDILGTRDDAIPGTTVLLENVMATGNRLQPAVPLSTLQNRYKRNLSRLPEQYKRIRNPDVFPVTLSARLAELQNLGG